VQLQDGQENLTLFISTYLTILVVRLHVDAQEKFFIPIRALSAGLEI
jgi:hypothetical protein